MKFLLYQSEAEQSYTLIKKGKKQPGLLEKDAKIVLRITASSWTDAVVQQEEFLYKECE